MRPFNLQIACMSFCRRLVATSIKFVSKGKSGNTLTGCVPPKWVRSKGFKYDKLLDGHIRILQVTCEPRRNGRRGLSTRLTPFNVNQLPHFMALSYAWPKPGTSTQPLQCHDQHMTVSTHVYNALENLCPTDAACSFAVWIDAVCIDQRNTIEKNKQVLHMGSVYGLASQVVVWLGPNHLVDEHRDTIEHMARQVQGMPEDEWRSVASRPPFSDNEQAVTKAVHSMILSAWFQRLWIVQEVCLAREVHVLSGRCFVPWVAFKAFFDLRYGHHVIHHGWSPEVYEAQEHGSAISDCRETHLLYSEGEGYSGDYTGLIERLNQLRSQKVSKPIDKVFGLLFILPNDLRRQIDVDYSEEANYWKTYVNLAFTLLRQPGGLNILNLALSREKAPGIPSWCPDWNRPCIGVPKKISSHLIGSSGGAINRPPKVRVRGNASHLQIQGFPIDRISYSVSGPKKVYPGVQGSNVSWLWQHQCLEMLKTHLGKLTDPETIFRVHLSNLTFGLWSPELEELPVSRRAAIEEDDWPEMHRCYQELVSHCESFQGKEQEWLTSMTDNAYKFYYNSLATVDRSYFVTENGRVGRGFPGDRAGDVLAVLYAAKTPFILRYDSGSDVVTLIGDAYLDGCMNLETMPRETRGPDTWFTIG